VLKGVAGIPACLGLEGRDCLVIEYIHGRLLGSYKRGELEACVFDRLDAIVKQAHARGVACGDLHQSNVIITADMRVFLIDFAHAVFASQGSRPGPLARLFMELDRNAVRRMRARYLGQDAPQPAGLFGCVYRFARRLKDARKKIKRCLA
jgi:RIO-like serine/threonine protein kinase